MNYSYVHTSVTKSQMLHLLQKAVAKWGNIVTISNDTAYGGWRLEFPFRQAEGDDAKGALFFWRDTRKKWAVSRSGFASFLRWMMDSIMNDLAVELGVHCTDDGTGDEKFVPTARATFAEYMKAVYVHPVSKTVPPYVDKMIRDETAGINKVWEKWL